MINFDNVIKENIKEPNSNWPEIPDNPYRTLIVKEVQDKKNNNKFIT